MHLRNIMRENFKIASSIASITIGGMPKATAKKK